MSLINLPERFLYERLPQSLIELDERGLICAVVGGYQDRIEDLRAYGKKFQLFFSSAGLPETGPNVIMVEMVGPGGKVFTRSLDITSSTPTDLSQLAAWAAGEMGVSTSQVSNARYAIDSLRQVDASILAFLATNIGVVLYASSVAENQPVTITQTGTYTATQLAHQRLIETYFPRLKFKGTARSFEALGKLLGFDDVRVVPLWGRVSPRLPSDPGSPVNDPDFSAVPEFGPRQVLGPFYDPLDQNDGPFYAWSGTASNGTASTHFYTQRINGFQPWVKAEVVAVAGGTVVHPAAGTYVLEGGAPHQKARVAASESLNFTAIGEGASWNGISVQVGTLADASLRRLDISDRLSSIKYRTSYYDLGITMDADKADATFGTLTAKTNKDIAAAPHAYASFGGTLYGTSPYRPFTGGTAAFQSVTGVQTSDFLTPFAGTVVTYIERHEATLGNYQQNYDDLAKAGQGVSQALEEVRAATRSPRRSAYGYLQRDTVAYAPIQAEECIGIVNSTGSQVHQFTGTFANPPLPPYTAQAFFQGTDVAYALAAETTDSDPKSVYFKTTYPGTVIGHVVLSGPGTHSYDFTVSGTFAERGTLCVGFYGTIGENNWPDTHEVVRSDAFTGTQVFAAIADYGYAPNIPGPEQDVADLVHSWNPNAIITLGDNDQASGGSATLAPAMAPYNADILAQRMFPVAGNHDNDSGSGAVLRNYFFNGTAPGVGGRYYSVRRGNTEFFGINTGWNTSQSGNAVDNASYAPTTEPDGNDYLSDQAQWLKEALRRSTAQWKIVYFHQPAFTSSINPGYHHPGYPRMRWPFGDWGANAVLAGHVHVYERLLIDGVTYINGGNSGYTLRQHTNVVIVPGSQFRWPNFPDFGDYMAVRITATESFLRFEAITRAGVLIDSYQINAADKRYMPRPEDELDDDLVFETMDEYPYRRDIVGGGELVETDFYSTGTSVEEYSILEQTTSVKDQTGAEHNVYLVKSKSLTGHRFTVQARLGEYRPAQKAIAFSGQFRDQATLTVEDTDLFAQTGGRTRFFRSELDSVFQPGYRLYHAGLVQGVLVADPDKFNGEHHRTGLAGWLPFNEHLDDDLAVRDASMSTAVQVLTGVSVSARKFDPVHGRYLDLPAGAKVVSMAARECYDDLTVGFWVRCPGAIGAATIVTFGAVKFAMDYSVTTVTAYAQDVDGAWQAVGFANASDWVFVYLRKTSTSAVFGSGNLATGAAETSIAGVFEANTGGDSLTVAAMVTTPFAIRDLRVWNVTKTASQMALVRSYLPGQTVVPYRIGHVLMLNDGDRYALQVLANGWLAPSKMPAWVRSPKFARVIRYDGRGEYHGEPWRKEVGLGGGQTPPATWQLGNQFYGLTATGTLVAAPTMGAMPGSNVFWQGDATGAPGSYIELSGSTSQGTTATTQTTGVGTPWPNLMEATNPVQDQVWLKDDNGHAYLCKLEASGAYGARFVAQPGTISNQEQADTIAFLAGTGYTLGVTGYGSVVQKAYAGSVTTPPLFMYLHDVLLEDVSGAVTYQRWTDPAIFGAQQGFPALKAAGELSLTNTATLLPGTYKLILDVGNVGKVDSEFDGFRVDITIGDMTVSSTLLPGHRGTNFRDRQTIEFSLDHEIVGEWLLTISWLNAYSDLARGTARQLVVYGYQLRRLETNLFQVSIAASGTSPILTRYPDLRTPNYVQVPGGWLLEFNSYGTIKATVHEGVVYPANDTMRSKYPLANMLTGVTCERREDVIVTSGDVVLGDTADPTIASFGTGIGMV